MQDKEKIDFVAPFGGRIFTFLGTMVKKGVSGAGGQPLWSFLDGPLLELQRRFAFHWSMLWDSK